MEDTLKQRIFNRQALENDIEIYEDVLLNVADEQFSLEEIMEALSRQEKMFVFPISEQSEHFDSEKVLFNELLVEDSDKKENPDVLLYELSSSTYYVYMRKRDEKKDANSNHYTKSARETNDKSYGLFAPTGVTVRRVPQNILGDGVLGRAFIHSNYIEILDSLMGDEYMEVLTHEVLHIMHPEKREIEIRQMTRNYVGHTIYN
jgi:hypothetical protein